jgi:hypothetical protein
MPRRNRKTGGQKGAPLGARNALRTGMRSSAMIENRKTFFALMQAAREAIRAARASAEERP